MGNGREFILTSQWMKPSGFSVTFLTGQCWLDQWRSRGLLYHIYIGGYKSLSCPHCWRRGVHGAGALVHTKLKDHWGLCRRTPKAFLRAFCWFARNRLLITYPLVIQWFQSSSLKNYKQQVFLDLVKLYCSIRRNEMTNVGTSYFFIH